MARVSSLARRMRRKLVLIGLRPGLLIRWAGHELAIRVRGRLLQRFYWRLVARPRAKGLSPPLVELGDIGDVPEALATAAFELRETADMALAHGVDLLGSGRVALGPEIDWHMDFKSGYRWPSIFYQTLRVTRLDDDSDAKVPWELSRAHQVVALARAAVLFGDERYAREAQTQLQSWMDANPPGYGINWVNPMEIGLRAVSWIIAAGTLASRYPLELVVTQRMATSLGAHAAHIELNLEGGPLLRSNHYVADILGMLFVGLFVDDPRSWRWRRFALRAFEREIQEQVHADGLDFEASLPYHGLVLEMFLLARWAAALAGRPLSENYDKRLKAMLDASRSLRHPNGRIPQVGDNDSGRVLPGTNARSPTHDNLLWLGAAMLDGNGPLPGPPHEEVAWTLGLSEWSRMSERPLTTEPLIDRFPDGGLFVLRAEGVGAHLVLRCGGVGQRGNGGHSHNDALSFELSWGNTWIVDPGTYVYTADSVARDEFRSARSHSVPVVDGQEPNPLPVGQPFVLPQRSIAWVEEVRPTTDGNGRLVAHLEGIATRGGPVCIRRTIELRAEGTEVMVRDSITGLGMHEVRSSLSLAPEVEVELDPVAGAQLALAGRKVSVTPLGAAASCLLRPGWVSDRYGVRTQTQIVEIVWQGSLPAEFGYCIRFEGPIGARQQVEAGAPYAEQG
jgi:Heparinase II/III-like protein/Heparinase II/III N-terminus